MDRMQALFSFKGRASRLTYWRVGLATSFAVAVIWVATIFVAMGAGDIAVIPLLLILPVLAANLAVCIRRLHDRNKSAWWLVVFWAAPLLLLGAAQRLSDPSGEGSPAAMAAALAAVGLQLWAFIEIGFRRGTPGDNRYGPPPPIGLRRRGVRAA